MIRFNCPVCGKGLKVAEELSGNKGRCPACLREIVVPASSTAMLAEELTYPSPPEIPGAPTSSSAMPSDEAPTGPTTFSKLSRKTVLLIGAPAIAVVGLLAYLTIHVMSSTVDPLGLCPGEPLIRGHGSIILAGDMHQRGDVAEVPALRVKLGVRNADDDWDYEIRPRGTDLLLVTDLPNYRWVEQGYEILDRKGFVVFSHPAIEDIGRRRDPLPPIVLLPGREVAPFFEIAGGTEFHGNMTEVAAFCPFLRFTPGDKTYDVYPSGAKHVRLCLKHRGSGPQFLGDVRIESKNPIHISDVPLTSHSALSYKWMWVDQPYTIRDSRGIEVYSHDPQSQK